MLQFLLIVGLTIGVGHVLIRFGTARMANLPVRSVCRAFIRALFYAPTLMVGGHGVGLVPTIVALVYAASSEEFGFQWQALIPALVVFGSSIWLSSLQGNMEEPGEVKQPPERS